MTNSMNNATMMKAVVFHSYGPPERLSLQEVPIPNPAAGEVRVRVHASTVGRTDPCDESRIRRRLKVLPHAVLLAGGFVTGSFRLPEVLIQHPAVMEAAKN